ncbi:MAG: hypothetical protein ACHQO8_01575 [Vicinamibacterales bacterium]
MADDPTTHDGHESAVPVEPAPSIESRFLFVDVASLRVTQLRRGARVRLPRVPERLERAAMDEVRQGLIHYTAPATPSSR